MLQNANYDEAANATHDTSVLQRHLLATSHRQAINETSNALTSEVFWTLKYTVLKFKSDHVELNKRLHLHSVTTTFASILRLYI